MLQSSNPGVRTKPKTHPVVYLAPHIHIYLPDSLFAKLKKRAEKLKKPMSEQIRESLEAYFRLYEATLSEYSKGFRYGQHHDE
ncbi:MAG: ribbon-helix-helix domain-containing protein [Peptococcaceae bacterium]|nr:ribbon-helix-helix domain-containing protein [Peptococcaceae bacterium]